MTSVNFNFFIEHDTNPFILFNNTGKIKYLNKSAELLMGACKPKEIFEIALSHAPQNFGVKKSIIALSFNAFEFYAINVLYENEEFIGIHLYNKPLKQLNEKMILDGFTLTDINILLQANIELFTLKYQAKIALLTDYDIPEFQMHQNNFSLLLQKIFALFNENKKVEINVKIKIGERVVIKEKPYPIILLEIKSTKKRDDDKKEIIDLVEKSAINLQIKKASIYLEIPAIS